jgi:hypothetical protein
VDHRVQEVEYVAGGAPPKDRIGHPGSLDYGFDHREVGVPGADGLCVPPEGLGVGEEYGLQGGQQGSVPPVGLEVEPGQGPQEAPVVPVLREAGIGSPLVHDVVADRDEDVGFPVGEIPVDLADVDARGLGDLVDGRPGVACLVEELHCSPFYDIPVLGPGLAASGPLGGHLVVIMFAKGL